MNDQNKNHVLWIDDEHLRQILDQRKTVEVRAASEPIAQLEDGAMLLFNDEYPFKIVRVSRYANFDELLAHEEQAAIAPDLSAQEILQALRNQYPPDQEAQGVVALEIAPVQMPV